MCQICMCSEHRGIINVVYVAVVRLCAHEGSGIGHGTHRALQDGPFLASLQARCNKQVNQEQESTLMTMTHCVGAFQLIVHAN